MQEASSEMIAADDFGKYFLYAQKDAWEIHREAQKMVRLNKASCVGIGLLIHHISDQKLYKSYGFDRLEDYMAAPQDSGGLDITPRTGYRYEAIARKFVVEMGLDAEEVGRLSPTKLDVLAPHVTDDNVDQVLADAEVLSTSSIRQNLRDGVYGNDPTNDPPPSVLSIRIELLNEYRRLKSEVLVQVETQSLNVQNLKNILGRINELEEN